MLAAGVLFHSSQVAKGKNEEKKTHLIISFHGLMFATLGLFIPSMLSGIEFKFSPAVLMEPGASAERSDRLQPPPHLTAFSPSRSLSWGRMARPPPATEHRCCQASVVLVHFRAFQEFDMMWLNEIKKKKKNHLPQALLLSA